MLAMNDAMKYDRVISTTARVISQINVFADTFWFIVRPRISELDYALLNFR